MKKIAPGQIDVEEGEEAAEEPALSPKLGLPDDPQRRRQMKSKVAAYEDRLSEEMTGFNSPPLASKAQAAFYRREIINYLFNQGELNYKEMKDYLENRYPNYSQEEFDKAFEAVHNFAKEGIDDEEAKKRSVS